MRLSPPYFLLFKPKRKAFFLKSTPEALAIAVVSFDLQSLYKKADAEELQKLKSFQKIKEELNNNNKEMGKIFSEILNDPNLGITFKFSLFLEHEVKPKANTPNNKINFFIVLIV